MMNQKGLELPIQIFIILFILLSVAILVLQLVTTQIEQQSSKLEEEAARAEAVNLKKTQESQCQQACKCDSQQAKAQFCIKLVEGDGLDLDGDGFANSFDTSLLLGDGVCEDRVLCSQLTGCECGPQKLNFVNCKEILCQFWDDQGLTIVQQNARISEFYKPGACYDTTDNTPTNHWFNTVFPGGTAQCGTP
jgi:hypothetical protein